MAEPEFVMPREPDRLALCREVLAGIVGPDIGRDQVLHGDGFAPGKSTPG